MGNASARFNDRCLINSSRADLIIFLLKRFCNEVYRIMANTAARSYCFTINNYTDKDLTALDALETDGNIHYYVLGFEEGESGTPHIQGYVECKPMRMNAMQALLGGRAHLEKRKGTRDQARNYCMKDGVFDERGVWKTKGQGRRTDLEALMEDIKKNAPKRETMEAMPATYSRHQRFAESYRAVVERDASRAFRQVCTTVLWGASGVGKTRYVHEHEDKVFWVHPDDSFPFDGYDGEEAIAFDDFYGNLRHHEMLRILDGYQLPVNVKGGLRYARWTRVYITSNCEPSGWYKDGLRALERRLTNIVHMELTQPCTVKDKPVTVESDSTDQICLKQHVTTKCNEVGGNSSAPTSMSTLESMPNNVGKPRKATVQKSKPSVPKFRCNCCGFDTQAIMYTQGEIRLCRDCHSNFPIPAEKRGVCLDCGRHATVKHWKKGATEPLWPNYCHTCSPLSA